MPEPVTVLSIDEDQQLAAIRREDGTHLGVNLWEIDGWARQADSFTNWKYAPATPEGNKE